MCKAYSSLYTNRRKWSKFSKTIIFSSIPAQSQNPIQKMLHKRLCPNKLTQFHSLTFSLGVGLESFRTFSKDLKNFKHFIWGVEVCNNTYCFTALHCDCFVAVMNCDIGLIKRTRSKSFGVFPDKEMGENEESVYIREKDYGK